MFIKIFATNTQSYTINTDNIVKIHEYGNCTSISFNNRDTIIVNKNYKDFLNTLVTVGLKIYDVSE